MTPNFRPLLLLFCAVLASCELQTPAPPPPNAVSIYPVLETDPVGSGGDAADDPAIWINSQDPLQSRVIGTNKRAGIEVYNLDGERLQFIPAGRTNNVDLRHLPTGHRYSALAAASNRSSKSVSLFAIDSEGQLTWLRDSEIDTGLTDPYGLCMYASGSGLQVIVNGTDGRFQQWQLSEAPGDQSSDPVLFRAERVREFTVSSQPEGCVVDDENNRLFYGIEEQGIYAVSADHGEPANPVPIMEIDGITLVSDVEGMSLYKTGGGGYLVVSSQGNFSFSVFDRLPPFRYRGSFVVADRSDGNVDGAQETDGLAVTSTSLGPNFPQGLIVVQDGFNTLPRGMQNFKYISWQELVEALML